MSKKIARRGGPEDWNALAAKLEEAAKMLRKKAEAGEAQYTRVCEALNVIMAIGDTKGPAAAEGMQASANAGTSADLKAAATPAPVPAPATAPDATTAASPAKALPVPPELAASLAAKFRARQWPRIRRQLERAGYSYRGWERTGDIGVLKCEEGEIVLDLTKAAKAKKRKVAPFTPSGHKAPGPAARCGGDSRPPPAPSPSERCTSSGGTP